MNVLVIGAQGYLGSHLADYLSNRHKVTCISRRAMPGALVGDVRSSQLHEEVAKLKFDAFVFTVSLNHSVGLKDWESAFDVGVKATFKFMELAQKCEAQKFIYFSTQQVYGSFDPNLSFREDSAVNPKSIYSLTHYLSEEIGRTFTHLSSVKAVSFRLANVIGAPKFPSAHIDSLVAPDLCKMAMREGVIKFKSDGTPQRSFILIPDICAAVEKVLETPNDKLPEVINMGSPLTLTLAELAWKIKVHAEKIKDSEVKIFLGDGSELKNIKKFLDLRRFNYPIEKLKALGVNPSAEIDTGIVELLHYYGA